MNRYIIQTIITCSDKVFKNKYEFKKWFEKSLVPQNKDPLRIYNFKLMEQYGHENFFLTFTPPNIGILTHIYQTQEEYYNSINLRNDQKKLMHKYNISYIVSDVMEQIID